MFHNFVYCSEFFSNRVEKNHPFLLTDKLKSLGTLKINLKSPLKKYPFVTGDNYENTL